MLGLYSNNSVVTILPTGPGGVNSMYEYTNRDGRKQESKTLDPTAKKAEAVTQVPAEEPRGKKELEFGAKFVQLRSTWEPNAQSIPLTRSALSIWLFRSRPSKPTVCNARIATLPPKAREESPMEVPSPKTSATSETKSAGKVPGSKNGSKKGAKKAAPKVGAKSRARKLSYSPDSQGDAPAAEAKAPAAKAASAAEAKAAAAAAAAQDGSTGETAVFVNDQPGKGGARTQDEVLKDLAELSKISSAAKAGLLGADAVLRLDNDTPPASPEEQRDKMKALVMAYTVHDGPDEADAEVAYFAWLPEGQYWSNVGLDLVLDFVVAKQVPPEVVFLIGPGRQLLPEKPGTPAPKAFKVWKRQLLLAVRAKVPGEEGKVIDDLRFCDEEDIDPVATKKYWDDHPGGPTKEFLQKAVDVLVEPHIRFANARNSGAGGEQNDNHWHGGGGGGGNGGGGRNNGMYGGYGGQQLPHIRSSRQAHICRSRNSRALLLSTTWPPAWISGTGGGMASGAVARSPKRTYCPGNLVLLFCFVLIAFSCVFAAVKLWI
eukprot:g58987.t1